MRSLYEQFYLTLGICKSLTRNRQLFICFSIICLYVNAKRIIEIWVDFKKKIANPQSMAKNWIKR